MKNDARILASLAQNSNPVPVISIDHLPRFTPLFCLTGRAPVPVELRPPAGETDGIEG
jgi:hypothetical protein